MTLLPIVFWVVIPYALPPQTSPFMDPPETVTEDTGSESEDGPLTMAKSVNVEPISLLE